MSTSPDSLTPRSPSTIDFLPSPTTTATSSADAADDRDVSDADREWRESLQQLELLLTMVLIPYVGKYFGRKLAFWSWGKYMEWQYPVHLVYTDRAAFRGVGVIEAASSL